MKISTRGRYGLRAMIDLALHEDEGRVTLAGIAARQDLSLNYLESIFSALKRAGFVIGTAGAQGGYSLARPADQISLQSILEALEGDLSVFEEADVGTPIRAFLKQHVWDVIDREVENTLYATTLADMVKRPTERHANVPTPALKKRDKNPPANPSNFGGGFL